jgi:hypothetical protein
MGGLSDVPSRVIFYGFHHRYVERTGDSIEVCSCYQDWLLPVTAAAPAHLTLEMECVLWLQHVLLKSFKVFF